MQKPIRRSGAAFVRRGLAQRLALLAIQAVAVCSLQFTGSSGFAHAGGILIPLDDDLIIVIPCAEVMGSTGTPGATVAALGRNVVSDGSGAYRLGCIGVGDHEVSVSKAGMFFAPDKKLVVIPANDLSDKRVDFRPALATNPLVPAFWGAFPPATTRAGMFGYAISRACDQGYYPEAFCTTGGSLGEAAAKVVEAGVLDEGALAQLAQAELEPRFRSSAKNHDLNGCSVLDTLPRIGPFATAQGGVLGGIDNLWFKRACLNHDQCFKHGFDPAWGFLPWGANGQFAQCNSSFYDDMSRTCDNLGISSFIERRWCQDFAILFYGAVVVMGNHNYHVSPTTSLSGNTLACAPKISHAFTTGQLGSTMRVFAPHATVDTNCTPAPSSLLSNGTTDTTVAMTWTTVPSAIGYLVFRNGALVTINPVQGPSFTDTGLAPSTTYSYYVRATFNGNQESGPSPTMSARTQAAPPPAAIPCGGAIGAAGGYSATGFTRTIDLGTAPGLVQIAFDALVIPDALTINSQNPARTLIFNTKGYVAGRHTGTYNYNFAALENRYFDVKILTDNRDTGWELRVSCPGQPLGVVEPPTRLVEFRIEGNTCRADWAISVNGGPLRAPPFSERLVIRPGHRLTRWSVTPPGATRVCGSAAFPTSTGVLQMRETGQPAWRIIAAPFDPQPRQFEVR